MNTQLQSSDEIVFFVAVIILVHLYYLLRKGRISLGKEVFNFERNTAAICSYGAFTILALITLWLSRDFIKVPFWLLHDPIWLIALHTLLQEMIFRTYLINRIKTLLHQPWLIALTIALIFSTFHFILPDATIVVYLTFIAGFVWSYLYLKYPNLLYVWISHFLINVGIYLIYQ